MKCAVTMLKIAFTHCGFVIIYSWYGTRLWSSWSSDALEEQICYMAYLINLVLLETKTHEVALFAMVTWIYNMEAKKQIVRKPVLLGGRGATDDRSSREWLNEFL